MSTVSIFLVALSLSMDTFAISLSNGLTAQHLTFKKTALIALCFAIFQTLMPALGWFAGIELKTYIMAMDHWIAFSLLLIIGARMIYEGYQNTSDTTARTLKWRTLVGQSIATSIDALVIGIGFAFMESVNIYKMLAFIGIITFFVSIAGLSMGKRYSSKLGKKVEIVGGLVLIGLGTKILIEHLLA